MERDVTGSEIKFFTQAAKSDLSKRHIVEVFRLLLKEDVYPSAGRRSCWFNEKHSLPIVENDPHGG